MIPDIDIWRAAQLMLKAHCATALRQRGQRRFDHGRTESFAGNQRPAGEPAGAQGLAYYRGSEVRHEPRAGSVSDGGEADSRR